MAIQAFLDLRCKKRGKRKLWKLRLLSSTQGEEKRVELYTALNRKLGKSKQR